MLQVLDDIVTRHLWQPVELSLLNSFPDGYIDEGTKQGFIASNTTSNREFYLVDIPRGAIETLVIQVLAYHSQVLLDRLFPPRPKPAVSTILAEKKDEKEIRGREEMETEIMQKLIAEGRVRPTGISWRNVVLKWMLDETVGTFCFAVLAFLLHCATRLHSPAQIAEELPGAISTSFFRYSFSASPLFSLLGHAYVPARLRGQFWAASALALNLTMSILLRPLVPSFMNLGWVQDFLRESVKQAANDRWWDSEMRRLDAKKEEAMQEMSEFLLYGSKKEEL